MDWAQVVEGVLSALCQRDDVIDLVGPGFAADVADATVFAHDESVALLFTTAR